MTQRMRAVARAGCAAALAIVLLAGVPVAAGPWVDRVAGYLVAAHSELLASDPGVGAVVATAPSQIRLVFSEPIDARYTGLDVADSSGTVILSNLGRPDPADPRVLVAELPAGTVSGPGLFIVRWHTLSAADGHVENGFYTFGIGDVTVAPAGATDAGASGGLHSGHSAGIVAVEIPGKVLGYGGSMLAVGLMVLGFLVLRPAALDEIGLETGEDRGHPDEPTGGPGGPGGEGFAPPAGSRGGRGRRGRDSRRAGAGARSVSAALGPGLPASSSRRRARSERPPPIRLVQVYRAAPLAAGWALIGGAAGCAILLAIAVATVIGSAGPDGVLAFVTTTRIGAVLASRILVALIGGIAVLALRRFGGAAGPTWALGLAGVVGLEGLALTATASHASAFISPVPTVADVIHLVSASIWLAGLGLLAALTDFGRASRLFPGALRTVIPRFSALALVSVAMIGFTGAYADWILTRDPFSAATPYQLNLVIKIVVFAAAVGLGAVNFLDGGDDRPWLGGLSKRLTAEFLVGLAVLAIAANMTSGSPSAPDRPVGIEPAASTASSGLSLSMDLLPGRPGPNRVGVDLPTALAPGVVVQLVLQPLDTEAGLSRVTMNPEPGAAAARFAADASLAESSRWDATVVATSPTGTEIGRQRFVFALDAEGVSEGRAVPPIDPAILLAVLLLGLGIVGLAFGLAGGVLPRTLPDASRPAVVGASTVGALLGLAIIMVAGPR